MMPRSALREIERKVWLKTFEHGLWDLAVGLLLLSFGVGILTEFYWISAIVVPVGLLVMRDLARRAIVPRIGHATFRGRRKRSLVHVQLILAVLVVMGLAMFAFTGFATRDAAPIGYHLGHALIGVGGLIALVGIGLFVRFVRRYPPHPEPVDGKDDG